MQNSYLLNSKKYFLLFYSSAFFFIFNIHAAEDEMVKIKPIKANQKSEELYKTKIKYRAKTKQNTNNFSFDIKDLSGINCYGEPAQQTYRKKRALQRPTARAMSKFYEALEKAANSAEASMVDQAAKDNEKFYYQEARAVLEQFDDKLDKLKSYDRSIIYLSWANLYVMDDDLFSAIEFYIKAINEPEITESSRNMAISNCQGLKVKYADLFGVDLKNENSINSSYEPDNAKGLDEDSEKMIPLVRVQPTYPRTAQIKGIEGFVELEFSVTKSGSVKNVKVTKSYCGNPDSSIENMRFCNTFNTTSIRAALKLKYKPKVVDGLPVSVDNVSYKFTYMMED